MRGTSTLDSSIGEVLDRAHFGKDVYGIIVFSHLRWEFVWQRPQQILSRLANSNPVLFIEEPMYDLAPGDNPNISLFHAATNISVASPHFPVGQAASAGELQQMVKNAIESVGSAAFGRPLLWYYNPTMADWSMDLVDHRGVVYDCMDELAQFDYAPDGLIESESRLIEKADIVFAGGYELWLKKRKQHKNAHFFGCGVEYGHFAQAQDAELEIPSDVTGLPSPVIGWFGVIDERFDCDLLREAATLRPDWSFVMVGPVVKIDPSVLPRGHNIHWLGQRAYAELPGYCKAFDACMMWFALNDATEFINPTKALEYLATGKPVFATAVRDVVRQYTEVINICATARQLVNSMELALASDQSQQRQMGIEMAKASSWEAAVARMKHLMEKVIAEREAVASQD